MQRVPRRPPRAHEMPEWQRRYSGEVLRQHDHLRSLRRFPEKTTRQHFIPPMMFRRCPEFSFVLPDFNNFNIGRNRLPSKPSFLCFLMDEYWQGVGEGISMVDRRCVCNEDYCNNKTWDEIMTEFTLPKDFERNRTAVPIKNPLGNNSLSHVVQALNPSQAPDGNGSQPVEGSFGVTAVTKPSGNDMNSDAASAGSATKGEGSTYVTLFGRAGSSTGLIVGIAAGVVILAVVAGGLWYWFKVRKRKDSTSGKSGNSARTANSQDTDASEEG